MTDEPVDGWRRWLHGRSGRIVRPVGVAVITIALGAIVGTLLGSGSSGPSRDATVARLKAIEPGSLVLAPEASPDELDEPLGLGSRTAGLALLAVSDVDSVDTEDGPRRAPEGSTLKAFEVGDWTCEIEPCKSWETLKPSLVVDGEAKELPEGGDTFVVVIPPGIDDIELSVEADGYEQSLSLTGGDPGEGNIALLAEKDAERRTPIGKTYRLGERTSIALDDGTGRLTDQFERQVRVDYAQLRFFFDGATPSSPNKAFLVLNAYYSYAGRDGRYVFGPGEAVFEDADGNRYDARDLDPAENKALLGFEVPASLRSGTLVLGGTKDNVSTTGTPYTSTLQDLRVPVTLG